MKTIIVASTGNGAGKTSVIVGLAAAMEQRAGYLKPFGDRLLYRKKRLWDYDALTLTQLWKLTTNPEDITIGFEHAKLHFMFDRDGVRDRVREMRDRAGQERDVVFIEAGGPLAYGASVHLDAIALAHHTGGEVVLVMSGNESRVMDELHFYRNYLADEGVPLAGIIINKVHDLDEFESVYRADIESTGVPILGIIPYRSELVRRTVQYLTERLLARVVAGDGGMGKIIDTVFIGAMSVSAALGDPLFDRENKVFITSGDRSDMILLAIESHASAVILTNNQLPPANILSRATSEQVPLLLVPWDTFTTVQKVEHVEALLQPSDTGRLALLEELMRTCVRYP